MRIARLHVARVEWHGSQLSVPIAGAVIGVIILLFGRKLFWLSVAAIGFAAGVELAPHVAHEPSSVLQLSIAIVLGFIGALLALFLQKIAIAIVGFVAGGRLALGLAAAFFLGYEQYYWITFLVGGIIGAFLLLALFDWALIFFSSVVGAYLIGRAIVLPPTGAVIMLIALTALGVVAQTAMFRRSETA